MKDGPVVAGAVDVGGVVVVVAVLDVVAADVEVVVLVLFCRRDTHKLAGRKGARTHSNEGAKYNRSFSCDASGNTAPSHTNREAKLERNKVRDKARQPYGA